MLTIVITTFNRSQRLFDQLKSIFGQKNFIDVRIIISDNCSDYDVEGFLKSSFTDLELSKVSLVINPCNIGMVGNISSAFLLPKTKWMWLISDDDETTPESIKTIFGDINLHPDVLALKYTDIDNNRNNYYVDRKLKTIPEFLDFCTEINLEIGNFIFMSNGVYNMEKINPYLKYIFTHSYSYFPHIIPFLLGLDGRQEVVFFHKSIVKYKSPEIPTSSDYLVSIYVGAMTVLDLPLSIVKNDWERLAFLFRMNLFWTLSKDLYNCSYYQKEYFYKKIYINIYGLRWSLKNYLIFLLFCFQIKINNDVMSRNLEKIIHFRNKLRSAFINLGGK